MTQKHVIHEQDLTEPITPVTRRLLMLVLLGIGLVFLLAVILAYIWPNTNEALEINNNLPVPYTNALEMQYAQPWLDGRISTANTVEYTNALEVVYAQPWLDAQEVSIAAANYSNAIEMQYAQPWLSQAAPDICHSRMDYAYACQAGRWLPEK